MHGPLYAWFYPRLVDMHSTVLERMGLDIAIEGPAASVIVSQTYRNNSNRPVEVTFKMGLGPMAVTRFECERDGIVSVAQVKTTGKARDDYDDSISMGHTAALGEYDKEKAMFEISLGNLASATCEELICSSLFLLTLFRSHDFENAFDCGIGGQCGEAAI